MCDPTGISEGAMLEGMVAMSAATAAVSVVGQQQAAKAQQTAIDAQATIRGKQVQAQAGQQLEQGAMRARAGAAASIAAASGAGINLASNSFMSSLQTTNMNQANESGLILENEKNQQQANTAETQSLLNSKASSPTFMGAALDIGLAGSDSYMKGAAMYNLGASRPTPNASGW